jgi:hypothetical protein
MSVYRENAKPFGIENFVDKKIIVNIYHGSKNNWCGVLKGFIAPTDSRPYWEFHIIDKGKDEVLIISEDHSFGLMEEK